MVATVKPKTKNQVKNMNSNKPAFTTPEQAAQLTKEQLIHVLACAESCLLVESQRSAKLAATNAQLLAALKDMLQADQAICDNIGAKSDQAMNRIAAIDSARAALANPQPTCADLACPCLQEQGGGK